MAIFKTKSAVLAVAFGVLGTASAAERLTLPIDPGTYVLSTSAPCAEAPLAAVLRFDGRSLMDAHEARCTTESTRLDAAVYRMDTVCSAHGDGSPKTPTAVERIVIVDSSSRISLVSGNGNDEYTICKGFH